MSVESVRADLARHGLSVPILETEASTATVELAARAHGVEPGRIAKTLAFRLGSGEVILLVARGDARIDNRKFKDAFGKGRMLPPDEVGAITGHPVGGVCPFGLAQPLPVWLDVSIRDFDEVLPAAGSTHNAVRLTPAQLEQATGGRWVDVCGVPGVPPLTGPAGPP
jgi:prolyl-tRNA editing enzyme YbaK/EbsC (Cys-tRNA(Pro) deacylase)